MALRVQGPLPGAVRGMDAAAGAPMDGFTASPGSGPRTRKAMRRLTKSSERISLATDKARVARPDPLA